MFIILKFYTFFFWDHIKSSFVFKESKFLILGKVLHPQYKMLYDTLNEYLQIRLVAWVGKKKTTQGSDAII